MRTRIEWQWEKLDDNSYRAKVIGGWILSVTPFTPSSNKKEPSHSAVFVPDHNHQWSITPPVEPVAVQRANLAKDFIPPKPEK